MSATLRSTPSPHALASKKMVGIVQAVEDSYGPYVTPKAHQFIHYAALEAKKHNSAGVVKYCTKALNCMQPFIRRRVTVQKLAIIVTSCVKYPTALPHHTSCMRQGSWCVCCIMETFFAVVGMCPDRFGCRGTHPHRVHHDPDAEADIEARACFDDDDACMMLAAQRAAEEICRLQSSPRARSHASASSDSDSSASSNGGRVRPARSAARAHAAPYARRTPTRAPAPDVAALADSLSAYAPFTPPTVDALAAQMAGYSIAQPAQEEKEQRARRALPSIAPLETVYASSVTVAGASDAESESSSSGGGRVRRSSRTSARSTASPYTCRSPRLAATPPPAAPAPSRAGSDSESVSVRRSPRTSTSARAAASPYARPTASPPPTRRAPAPAPAPSPAPVAQELDALAAGLAAYTPFAPPTVDALVGQLAGTSLVERPRYTLPRVEVPLYASDQTVAGAGPKRASWPRTLAESVSVGVRC